MYIKKKNTYVRIVRLWKCRLYLEIYFSYERQYTLKAEINVRIKESIVRGNQFTEEIIINI